MSTSEPFVCPPWIGNLLLLPFRRWVEPPDRLLGDLVKPGDVVLEPGCGMGYFTLPLAERVGPSGRVLCVDLQDRMLERTRDRARRAGLGDRIETRRCRGDSLAIDDWTGRCDVAIAIHMVHEVSDSALLFRDIHAALRPGGRLLVIEPFGHVSRKKFAANLEKAESMGFRVVARSGLRAVLER